MDKVSFSIIITTYNSENSIERVIKSILNQEGISVEFGVEIIVVDDCSTDKTVEIVKSFDVKLLTTQENTGGPNKGRNIGLKFSTGDYICIVDHDDEWMPKKLQTQLPYLKKSDIVTSGFTIIDEVKNTKIANCNTSAGGVLFYEKNATFLKRFTKSLAGQKTYLGSIIFHNKLKSITFEEYFGAIDYDWLLKLFHERDSIEITESLYFRYVEGGNLSLNINYRRRDFYYSLLTIENYRSIYPKEYLQAYKRIYGSRARYHYFMGEMKLARFYFRKSNYSLKTIMYYLTTFYGYEFVKKRFNIFG